MSNKLKHSISGLFKNVLFKNSSWGVISQISQTVLLSLFFVILARKYSTVEFSKYIIATVLYQLITAFSAMGLSQWFIREIACTDDKKDLISKFLKIQILFGFIFYMVNIGSAFLLYDDHFIRLLCILVGVNIIFDNVINAIKSLNIAYFEQKKTFIILTIDAALKFLIGLFLFIYPLQITVLSIILIVIRFITLNLFIKYGSSSVINLKTLWKYKISFVDIRHLVFLNWPFIIISGVSIINWRMANILISKMLSITDVANYEITYRIFSIAQILPVIISTTVFPILIKLYNEGNFEKFRAFYKTIHLYYLLFGLLSFIFIYSFADYLVPAAFGTKYAMAAIYTKQMFFTILVFPTAFLQANMLIAMNLEKKDMLFNIILMCVNVSASFIGLHYLKSLSAVNYSIFFSFFIFHILQDVLLMRKKITSIKQATSFYLISAVFIITYIILYKYINPYLLFLIYCGFAVCILLSATKFKNLGIKYFNL
jgi:O-antigen/teichoic acid export membrane protein